MNRSLLKKSLLLATPLALIAAIAIPASASAATNPRHITVSAEGTVKVTPDAVRLSASISALGKTNKEALAEVATGADALRLALKNSGVASKDIASQNVSVNPEYNYTNDNGAVLVGYRAVQSFSVVIRNADKAGTIVDDVVAASTETLVINGVSPFILDTSKATEAARAAAVKSAKIKAASYAKLLGVKLGKVSYIVENSSPAVTPPIYTVGAEAKADAVATVIDLGQQDVTVSISIRWSL
jgi:uncharacterized protein YggE